MATRKTVRRSGKRHSWAVRFLLIALALFLFLKAVQLYGQIEEKRQSLKDLDNRIQTQLVRNEGLADQAANAGDYIEHNAYENGYFLPEQQVFQSDAG